MLSLGSMFSKRIYIYNNKGKNVKILLKKAKKNKFFFLKSYIPLSYRIRKNIFLTDAYLYYFAVKSNLLKLMRKIYIFENKKYDYYIHPPGLQFKGVKKPEQIYVMGIEEIHIQPPKSGEKVKRIGGSKKIKVKLRNKKLKEIIKYFFDRISAIVVFIVFLSLVKTAGSFHGNALFKGYTGINLEYWLGWLYPFYSFVEENIIEIKKMLLKMK